MTPTALELGQTKKKDPRLAGANLIPFIRNSESDTNKGKKSRNIIQSRTIDQSRVEIDSRPLVAAQTNN